MVGTKAPSVEQRQEERRGRECGVRQEIIAPLQTDRDRERDQRAREWGSTSPPFLQHRQGAREGGSKI